MPGGLKLAIIGGGSTYNPPFINAVLERKTILPFEEIVLQDIDKQRLDIVYNFTRRHCEKKDLLKGVKLWATTNLSDAVSGADFIIYTIRPGGNRLRALGERIAFKHGLFGEETIGFEGFAFALRTIPQIVEISKEVQRSAPNAWVIDVTNPVPVITEAIPRCTNVRKDKVIGIGSIRNLHKYFISLWLGVDPDRITKFVYVGHKHFGWFLKIWVDGEEVPVETLVEKYTKWLNTLSEHDWLDPQFVRDYRWPIPDLPPFFKYYFMTDVAIEYFMKKKGRTRGEEVVEVQDKILEWYAKAETIEEIPEECFARGSLEIERAQARRHRGYSAFMPQVIEALDAIINDRHAWICEFMPQSGAVEGFDELTVIRLPFILNKAGYTPIKLGRLPPEIDGILHMLKAHDYLTIQAAMTGSMEYVVKALMSHPLTMNYYKAKAAFLELVKAAPEYYPQFQQYVK